MHYTLQNLIDLEESKLKPYAVTTSRSKGRAHTEYPENSQMPVGPLRLAFQKDRDRVMHSRAFRRLKGKTQVFVAPKGDHYRNRLIHSVEVAQVSRDIARTLGLNEDLAEVISLSHDLGHTPFGHAGQDALDEMMQEHGLSFEHNRQSLRIVDHLENVYPLFRGLNLSHEVREGMMKHQTSWDNQGQEITAHPCLEAQIVNLGDEIAYNSHDIDDGVRSGIITLDELNKVELWRRAMEVTEMKYGKNLSERHAVARGVSSLMSILIDDVTNTCSKLLELHSIRTLEDVYAIEFPLVGFSEDMKVLNANLKSFLARTLYFSNEVKNRCKNGQTVIKSLFTHYINNESEFREIISQSSYAHPDHPGEPLPVLIKDYIAGMTDGFAQEQLLSLSK